MWRIVVVLLVSSPREIPLPHHAPEPAWAALRAQAWDLELTGPHCQWVDDFRSEVAWVRRHARESIDWPPLHDVDRFPPRPAVLGWRRF
jgi:hypothetical protein